jgi:hypothetical protein
VEGGLHRAGEPTPARLEHAPLDFGEAPQVGGEGLGDLAVEVLHPAVELPGGPPERRGVFLGRGWDAASGLPEDLLARRVRRGHAVGREERGRLAGPQRVPPRGLPETDLVLLREGGERERDVDGEGARIQSRLELGGEPAPDRDPLVDPALAVAEQLADGRGAEAVLVEVGKDDAGLVHRAGCPPGGVRLEEQRLVEDGVGLLDDDWRLPEAVFLEGPQALEAVDHLEGPVGLLDDSDGKGLERVPAAGPLPAESGEGRPELLEAEVADPVHGPSRARIW